MSNITLFKGANVPAFAKKGELSETAKALVGSGGGGGKRISIKGGVFRLMSDGEEVAAIEERYLDVVIVRAAPKVGRVWYAAKYDGETAGAPECWSADGDKPDAKAKNPQADTCAKCEQNIAGSGTGNSRACRYQQRLAVVLADEIEGDVMQLPLPATSLFGKEEGENRPLQAYARWLVAQGVDPSMVVTRLKFDTKAESPKLFFKAMRWLTDDEFATANERGLTDDAVRAVTMTVAAVDAVKPADALEGDKPKAKAKAKPQVDEDDEDDEPPAPKAKVKTKAKPAPEPEDDDDEDEAPAPKAKTKAKPVVEEDDEDDEPVVRKESKKETSVPAKKKLAQVVADWDDEE